MTVVVRVSPRAPLPRSAGIKGERVQMHNSFSLRSQDCVPRPYSGSTATMATGRYVSVPSFREQELHK